MDRVVKGVQDGIASVVKDKCLGFKCKVQIRCRMKGSKGWTVRYEGASVVG